MARAIDLTGQRFGKLLVLERAEKPENKKTKGVYWKCQCDCGNIVVIYAGSLQCGQTKSCGCIRKEINHKDLTNQKFGRLTALYAKDAVNGHRIWHCKCECGNECDVSSQNLLRKHTKSCGCLNRDTAIQSLSIAQEKSIKDLTNKKFNRLVPIERISGSKEKVAIWKCKCDCGTITYATTNQLTSGTKQSCGCLISKGEQKLKEIFIKENINFQPQKTFKDLFSQKGFNLRFDFYLPDYNCCIEYQGHFHYDPTDFYYSITGQENDKIKKEYCLKNKIRFIEIPYWDYNKLDWNYIKEKLNEN